MTTHDSVTANFGGRRLTFKIDRADLAAFEAATGLTAYAALKRFMGGAWSIDELTAVLKFGLLAGRDLESARVIGRTFSLGYGGGGNAFFRAIKVPHVGATLKANPPGPYATLASCILSAVLFGVDEAGANFDDGVPLGAA